MTSANGRKPLPDPDLLTPNDWRRLRVALGGEDPRQRLGEIEDMLQLLTLAYKLRSDPSFTWEQAGDVAPASMFDTSGGQSPPDPSQDSPAGTSGGSPSRSGKPRSARKPRSSGSASNSATSTA